MRTRKLQIPCPQCESLDVSYSCSPSCCFNHVCAGCHTTFEPVTHPAGGKASTPVIPPDPLPDSADCTVACARCESLKVYSAGDGLVCAACGTLLTLELTEIAPG